MFGLESGVEFLAATASNAASGDWDIGSFLTNSSETLRTWFNAGLLVLGLVAIVYATWQIVSGLMSHGKKQVNWAVSIILLLVGGVLASTTGFDFMQGIAGGGKKTIEDLGTGGTIMLFEYAKMSSFFK